MFHAIVSLCNNHRPLVRAKLASIKFDFAYSSFIWRCVLLTNDFSPTLQLATHADNCIASPFELAVVEHTCARWFGVCPELLRWTKCVYCGDIFFVLVFGLFRLPLLSAISWCLIQQHASLIRTHFFFSFCSYLFLYPCISISISFWLHFSHKGHFLIVDFQCNCVLRNAKK